MKKTLLVVVCAFMSVAAFAQKDAGFGIKAGLNYNKNGDLIGAVGDAAANIIEGSDGKVGFHVGVFGKLDLATFYLKPELVYTKTQSSYDLNGTTTNYDISKIDLPVLLGYNVVGPVSVFAGPTFQYILNNDLETTTIDDVNNQFTLGLNLGVGVNLGNIGVDVRYERGFTENEANFIGNNITNIAGRVDSRPEQIVFGVSLKL